MIVMADKIFFVLVILISYIIGSLNASIVLSKIKGNDIRNHGSGNAGATNMLRTYGIAMAVEALVLDMLKGIFAVLLAMFGEYILKSFGIENSLTQGFKYISALFVVIGHNYPVLFGFKGGKGIATSGAIMFMLDWRAGIIVLIGALAVMALTRYVSLGSIVGAILYIITPLFFCFVIDHKVNLWFICVSILLALLAIYRHRANIVRLINGTESKLGSKSKK